MVLNVNARSLLNKIEQFEAILIALEPDIICVTETWLHCDIGNCEVAPPGYFIVRKDRLTRGGGVALLLRQGISYTVMPDVPGVEAVWCRIQLGQNNVCVGAVYRPPLAEASYLEQLLEYMQKHMVGNAIIMGGDFNLPDINWNSLSPSNTTNNILLSLMFTFNLTQVVSEPTRMQGTSNSLLDLIFLSDFFLKGNYIIQVLEGISDHDMVLCTLTVPKKIGPRSSRKPVYAFNKADDDAIMTYLVHEYHDFSELILDGSASIDQIWLLFKAHAMHCLRHYVPQIQKNTNKLNPWITRDVIHLKRKIKRLRKSNKTCPVPNICQKINSLNRLLKQETKMARQRFCSTTLSNFIKHSPQKFWRYIRRKENNAKPLSPKEEKQQAEAFNVFFHSVYAPDNGITHDYRPDNNGRNEALNAPVITEAGVLSLLLKLDDKKSSGPDGIPNCFLKRYAEPVSKYLCLLYNKSVSEQCLPAEWKIAKIIPVYKSGNTSFPSNYRPISLTCTCCKILEHIILKSIAQFVEANNILHPYQHGFRTGLSTVTQLVEINPT